MGSECERCGISQEDYACEFENYGGQELCEQCSEEAREEDDDVSLGAAE